MKNKIKAAVDVAMISMLPALMAYQLVGEALHEYLGAVMFTFLAAHNILNWKWYRNLFKGRYTAIRVLQTAVNFLLLIIVICLLVSGISMSHYLFATLPFGISASLARIMHLLASYWGFIIMSFHLGLHWNMILVMLKKKISILTLPGAVIILRITAVAITSYGVFAFYKRGLGSYMLLKSEYVFYNFDEPLIFFFIDYIAVMGLFAVMAHYLSQAFKKYEAHKNRKKHDGR